jgi:enoyl-CoA hydratase/carnithine racemase
MELATLSSPRSVRIMKQQLWNSAFQTLGEAIHESWAEIPESFASADFQEGVAAFTEKRTPRFTGA